MLPNRREAVLDGRRLVTTKSGKIGVVPARSQSGDVIVYLSGASKATVLRKVHTADLIRTKCYDTAEKFDKALTAAFELKDQEPKTRPYGKTHKSFAEITQPKPFNVEHYYWWVSAILMDKLDGLQMRIMIIKYLLFIKRFSDSPLAFLQSFLWVVNNDEIENTYDYVEIWLQFQ